MSKKKFKAIEKDALDAPVKNVEWEGEEIGAVSKTNIQDDKGEGQTITLRFFDFKANPETFRIQKPTAQQLFNTHLRGIESSLWMNGLKVFSEVTPRLMFSKDKSHYRFIIAAISDGTTLQKDGKALSELLTTPT